MVEPVETTGVVTTREVVDLARASTIVLDSWHLYDGAGVAVDRHRARFTRSVRDVFGVDAQESGAAYDHALGQLPLEGSWFPAFVWTVQGLQTNVRPFPVEHLRTTATLQGTPVSDSRKRPDIKGIDYLWQLEQRADAARAGYDDRLLVTSTGLVSETVFGSLAVVHGDELLLPDAPRLPSVTESVIRDRAGTHGLRPAERPLSVEEIRSADTVLTLSALHGIRLVDHLGDRALRTRRQLRDALQATLEAARRPVCTEGRSCGSC